MNRQRGYSLLEVIVAFALLALALTFLLGTLTGSTRQLRQADEITRATLHAQSLLAVQGIESPLVPGHTAGDFEQGRFRWTLDVQPYVDPRPAPASAELQPVSQLRLLQLDLKVGWGESPAQQLQWHSLRLAPLPTQGAGP
ncbi:MAG TPA: prepilin-type N-terminal cleavage/methylation domain-containing protein [Stenotrophomonas sp.]